MQHLQEVFERHKKHNLKLHMGRTWQFFQTQVKYMGHIIYPSVCPSNVS
jgi:hypothetical protein